MMRTGLVSVSFRALGVEEIAALCERAGLNCVEWGGDVHVPPDDATAAERALDACRRHGVSVCSYGSYFRLGQPGRDYEACVRQAVRLGAGVMRIWAGRASDALDEDTRRDMTRELIALSAYGAARGVKTAPEFHGGTLTDTRDSAERLLRDTAQAPGVLFYWQPRWDWPEGERLAALRSLRPRLAHVHVFTWREDGEKRPLAEGADMWKKALPMCGPDACALLEFVRGDDPEQLIGDAATLRGWLAG